MPRGVLGMNASMMEEYLKFIANRRLTQIGLEEELKGVTNPFPWMSEIMDLRKEKNFFETRVIEYQTGGALNWGINSETLLKQTSTKPKKGASFPRRKRHK